MTFHVLLMPDHCPIKFKEMKRTINNNAVRLETEVTFKGYTVQGRKRSKAVYQSQSSRSAKSNKIQRNAAKLDNLETALLRQAFKAKRKETRQAERMEKRKERLKRQGKI